MSDDFGFDDRDSRLDYSGGQNNFAEYSQPVTGQPAPPTPRPELVQAICRGYLATQHLSNPLQVAERIAVEVEAATQPLTPPLDDVDAIVRAGLERMDDGWPNKAQAAPASLTAPPDKVEWLAELLRDTIGQKPLLPWARMMENPTKQSWREQAKRILAVANIEPGAASLTAEELAPLLSRAMPEVLFIFGSVQFMEFVTKLCSLPGIKVVRG